MKILGKVPLERALSKLGIASRSSTREMIEAGRLTINGKIVTDPDFMLTPERAHILIDGISATRCEWRTVILYKPRGYVTTTSDEKNRKTVMDLLPPALQHLHPVGRLDLATSGLLMLTTDTQLSNYLTDPKNQIPRCYAVSVRGEVIPTELAQLREGVVDDGESLTCSEISVRKTSRRESHLNLTLIEGKNREIRRMFKVVGHEVTALKRISFGPWTLSGLDPGKFLDVLRKDLPSKYLFPI